RTHAADPGRGRVRRRLFILPHLPGYHGHGNWISDAGFHIVGRHHRGHRRREIRRTGIEPDPRGSNFPLVVRVYLEDSTLKRGYSRLCSRIRKNSASYSPRLTRPVFGSIASPSFSPAST